MKTNHDGTVTLNAYDTWTSCVEMLQSAMNKAEQDGASNVLILMKTDGVYTRFSTKMDDVMEIIAQLEVLKYDILRRMHS